MRGASAPTSLRVDGHPTFSAIEAWQLVGQFSNTSSTINDLMLAGIFFAFPGLAPAVSFLALRRVVSVEMPSSAETCESGVAWPAERLGMVSQEGGSFGNRAECTSPCVCVVAV